MPPFRMMAGLGLFAARLGLASLRRPRRRLSLAERLRELPRRGLPLRRPVAIHWNDHHVPFIEAEDDRDLAVALGLVHAHLRLGQMEMLRHIARGRVAELVGPVALDLDRVLRLLDFGRAVPGILRRMPDDTRTWIEGFAAGVNAAIARLPRLPREFAVFGLEPTPWSVEDVLTVGRLAAADFTWTVWFKLLRHRARPDWLPFWQRLMQDGAAPVPSLSGAGRPDALALDLLLKWVARTGSNSLAVAAERSATGAALLASDPHLSVLLPNLWLIAGYRSPGHHAVGLMVPGVPAMALGRNPWIGWGGTNLHAASSELFDVTDLPAGEIKERRESVAVRWWPRQEVVIRETPYGPVVSDLPLLRAPADRVLALHWIGHTPTDEITALLGVNRARNWGEFRAALDGFAIPAQNMIFADAEGRVGQAMAARLPRRPPGPPADVFATRQARDHWQSFVTANDLPGTLDPPQGFVASANNRPAVTPVPVGFFFSPDDRVRRLSELLGGQERLGVEDLRALQQDVLVPSAPELRDILLQIAGAGPERDAEARRLLEVLAAWDGRYAADSAGAVAFELLVYHFIRALHGDVRLAVYTSLWDPWRLVREDLETTDPIVLAPALDQAIAAAAEGLARHRTWGDMHRLRLAHVLGAVPGVGRAFRFVDAPVAGSNETVMKTAHGFTAERHAVRYGSNARHISDFADPDRNFFVLLGGQDGDLDSATFLDQFALWRRGDYIQLPLRPETARAAFPHKTVLEP